MPKQLAAPDMEALFASVGRRVFRLEAHSFYDVPGEREGFRQFLAGEPQTPPTEIDWWAAWLDQLRAYTAAGKAAERVRVLAEPPTRYQEWEFWGGEYNEAAGERILYIRRSEADEIDLPLDKDWWIFDDDHVVLMHHDAEGKWLGNELVEDPETTAQYCAWRNLARRHSAPLGGLRSAS